MCSAVGNTGAKGHACGLRECMLVGEGLYERVSRMVFISRLRSLLVAGDMKARRWFATSAFVGTVRTGSWEEDELATGWCSGLRARMEEGDVLVGVFGGDVGCGDRRELGMFAFAYSELWRDGTSRQAVRRAMR